MDTRSQYGEPPTKEPSPTPNGRCVAVSPRKPDFESPPPLLDRWWAYSHLPLARRQLCWAHLKRDFAAHAEGLAAEKEFGQAGLELCERVFWAWEVFEHTMALR
jgi:hypothetical protein